MRRFKATTLFIHAVGWLLFLMFPILFMNREQNSNSAVLLLSPYYWLFCLTYIILFYLNAWYLVPGFVFKKKILAYSLIVLVLFGCVFYLQPFDNLLKNNGKDRDKTSNIQILSAPPPGYQDMNINAGLDTFTPPGATKLKFGPLPHQDMRMQDPNLKPAHSFFLLHQSANVDMVSLFIYIMIIGLSTATSTVQRWQTTEQQVVKAEAEKANAELSFLKAQINPHFLFNTLNNIYTMSVTQHEHTSDSIMMLSNIMRYVTDDVTEDFVLLQHEINCIQDYISLQKLRLGSKTQLNFEVEGLIGNQKIAPLIIMTFVENVFKYGISKHHSSVINIKVKVLGECISLFCQNTLLDHQPNITRTGIGITNTRQRLELLYPKKYQLEIDSNNQLFTVQLRLNC
ncbi:MAG: hypothetical protein EOP42_11220 [Sphingobacteriaceae bacterium]|nr:MAG: hypothetical protein EOP42_11220 [Sphingobacteriaceae bacterium]